MAAEANTDTVGAAAPLKTPLHARHVALGARMVGFGGYDMPVQYEGVLAEHRWTREHAGLFDVSHMGQCKITGADATAQFERFVPGDYAILKDGKLTLFDDVDTAIEHYRQSF